MLGQLGADIFEDHLGAQLLFVVETESLEVAHHLGKRLGERGQVENGPVVSRVGEYELLREDRLPRSGMSHDDVDRVRGKSAAEDVVGLGIAGRQPLYCVPVARIVVARCHYRKSH